MAERPIGRRWIGYSIVLVGAALLLCYEIDEPFVGQHESAAASVANYARNMVRYGYWETRMGLIIDSGPLDLDGEVHYYLHCTPLLSFLVSLLFHVFGVHEWCVRLVPVLQALGCIVLLIVICERLWGRTVALVAACFLAASPIFAYYGRVAEFVTFTGGFLLLTTYAYLQWREQSGSWRLFAMLAAALLGVLASFEGWFLPLLLALHYMVTGDGKRKTAIWLLPVMSVVGVAVQAGHVAWLVGFDAMMADAFEALARRGALGAGSGRTLAMVSRNLAWTLEYVTLVPVVLAALWAGRVAVRWWARLGSQMKCAGLGDSVILVLIGNRVVVSLLFAGHAAEHEFSLYGLMPGLAMASGVAFVHLWRALLRKQSRLGRIVAKVGGGLVMAAFFVNASANWSEIHRRTFYAPWYGFALHLNQTVDFGTGLTFNCDPYGYPGYYLPFYLDRRVAWRVASPEQAGEVVLDRARRFDLAVFFARDPVSDQVAMNILRREDLGSTGRRTAGSRLTNGVRSTLE